MTLAKLIKPRDVKGDTNFDIILKAWLGHKVEELPAELQTMVKRWKCADDLLRNLTVVTDLETRQQSSRVNRQNDVIEFLIETYGVSARTAWEDIANAKRFFLSCETRGDKEFARGVMIEWGEKMMFRAFDLGDFKAAAAFYKELNDIKGLHEQSADVPDYADFQPPNFVVVSSPIELGFDAIEDVESVVKRILANGRREFIDAEAVDAEVEE